MYKIVKNTNRVGKVRKSNKTLSQPQNPDLRHSNLEGCTRAQVISVLENRGVSPDRILLFLLQNRMF